MGMGEGQTMTLRKGQHLFNEISKKHRTMKLQDFHRVLYYIEDAEFDRIMKDYKP